jgi:hypothetical protein
MNKKDRIMKNMFTLLIGCILLSSLFGQNAQELMAKKKQLMAQIDTELNDLYLGIEPKDEFETFKEYLQRIFMAVSVHYDDQYQKLNEIYYGELKNIDMKLDDFLNQEKQSRNIVVTLHRYIAERSIYSMDISIENIALGTIEAEIEREDAKQLKRNWANVQKVGYLKADGLGNFNPSHFQLTNPATGFVFTHFFDITIESTDRQIRSFIEKVQVIKVPFYKINPGEVVMHENESMMYMEEGGTFYIQIKRDNVIHNIIDGIEYGPYNGATFPIFENDGWYFFATKNKTPYKVSYDLLGATEIESEYEYNRISKPQHIDQNKLFESKKDQFSTPWDNWSKRFENKIAFSDRSYIRTGSLSTDSKYDEWAIGVYKSGSNYDNAQGPHLRTSYGTFEPDSWDIGFIKLNGKEFYCFGTLENRTITLNFPMKYSID